MKKRILILILFIISLDVFSQNEFNNLFLSQPNISKFEARKILSQNTNIVLKNDWTNTCYWGKFDYLKNDSTYDCVLNFNFISNNYFNGFENKGFLLFADDKLFSTIYHIKYEPSEINACINDYNALRKLISAKFPDGSKTTISQDKKDGGKEQIGEGYVYSIKSEEEADYKKNGLKFQKYRYVGITYSSKNKHFENYTSNEIEYYLIEINYIDMRNVKFDTRGFPTY